MDETLDVQHNTDDHVLGEMNDTETDVNSNKEEKIETEAENKILNEIHAKLEGIVRKVSSNLDVSDCPIIETL